MAAIRESDRIAKTAHADPSKAGWKNQHIHLSRESLTLREAVESRREIRAHPEEVPLAVRLVENPNYRVPGLRLFSGAVTLDDHDCIHALLGRGLLPKDEAFTIGFTMGSTKQPGAAEARLYSLIAKHVYPKHYRFNDEDMQVFDCGLQLGKMSRCRPLDRINYLDLMETPLGEVRKQVGIETDLLRAYYHIESARFPHAQES